MNGGRADGSVPSGFRLLAEAAFCSLVLLAALPKAAQYLPAGLSHFFDAGCQMSLLHVVFSRFSQTRYVSFEERMEEFFFFFLSNRYFRGLMRDMKPNYENILSFNTYTE